MRNIFALLRGFGGKLVSPTNKQILGWGLALNVGIPLLIDEKGKKTKGVIGGVALTALTAGMGMGRWAVVIPALTGMPQMMRSISGMYKNHAQARMTAAVPFSHSPAAMDLAGATMQNAMALSSSAHQSVGSEAVFFGARFTNR